MSQYMYMYAENAHTISNFIKSFMRVTFTQKANSRRINCQVEFQRQPTTTTTTSTEHIAAAAAETTTSLASHWRVARFGSNKNCVQARCRVSRLCFG